MPILLWIGVVIVILLGLAGLELYGRLRNTPKGPSVKVSNYVTLQYLDALTVRNPSYQMGGSKGIPWLYKLLPSELANKFPILKLTPANEIGAGRNLSVASGTILLGVKYPADWSNGEPRRRVADEIKNSSINSYRFVSGDQVTGFYNLQLDEVFDHSPIKSQKPEFYFPLQAYNMPLFEDTITIQFANFDERLSEKEVIRQITLPNPFHSAFDPLPASKAQVLPAIHTNPPVEVSLRALVGNSRKSFTDSGAGDELELLQGMPLTTTGPLGSDYFPVAVGGKDFCSYMVGSIGNDDSKEPEWILLDGALTYGKDRLPFIDNSPISFRLKNNIIWCFKGNVCAYPQPMRAEFKFVRVRNHPADEIQVVELLLPARGQSEELNQTVRLHDSILNLQGLGYVKMGSFSENSPLKNDVGSNGPYSLCLLMQAVKRTGLISFELLGKDGSVVEISRYGKGGRGSYNKIVASYVIEEGSDNADLPPLNYDDYTTARLTFKSERVVQTEFVVNAMEATGGIGKSDN